VTDRDEVVVIIRDNLRNASVIKSTNATTSLARPFEFLPVDIGVPLYLCDIKYEIRCLEILVVQMWGNSKSSFIGSSSSNWLEKHTFLNFR